MIKQSKTASQWKSSLMLLGMAIMLTACAWRKVHFQSSFTPRSVSPLQNIHGEPIENLLSKDEEDRPVLFLFFKDQASEVLNQAQSLWVDGPIPVKMVAVLENPSRENLSRCQAWQRHHPNDFSIVIDPDHELMTQWAVPDATSYVIMVQGYEIRRGLFPVNFRQALWDLQHFWKEINHSLSMLKSSPK